MKRGKTQQAARDQRQFCIEARKHLGEYRYHKDIDDDQRQRHRNHHKHRVAHGLLDALAHVALKFHVFGQAQEDFRKPPVISPTRIMAM